MDCANILIKSEEMVLRTSDLQAVGQKQRFPGSSTGKIPPAMQETLVQFLGWEDPLEKGMGFPLQYS